MSNFKKQYVVNRHLINIGDKFTVGDGFFKYSQSKTKGGEYKLEMVDINKTDVFIKGISKRNFFYWEDPKYIDSIIQKIYEMPPIILEKMGGTYYSVDGHHRITSACELGIKKLPAFVIEVDKLTYPRS